MRRRSIAAAALGVTVAVTSVVWGPNLYAEESDEPTTVGHANEVRIGEVLDTSRQLSYLGQREQSLHYPDSRFVKVHFERLDLREGDYVTVSDPGGTEEHRYTASDSGLWATSVSGDTAVVELHSDRETLADLPAGVSIDQVSRGLSGDEVSEHNDEPRTESVCGEADQRDAVCYKSSDPDVYASAEPVARLLIGGTTLCTAWRVGDQNRLLTNNHCFDNSEQAKDTEVWFNYACETCDGDDTGEAVKVRGDKVLETDTDYDYTLFTVDDFDAIEKFGSLTLSQRQPDAGEELYIPQHPSGDPTQIAMDSDADNGSCVVDDPSYSGYLPTSDVSYLCDTEFGSSGSPVMSKETHEVIALHHFGGCPNSGVRADEIHQRIAADI